MEDVIKRNVLSRYPFFPEDAWDAFYANAQSVTLRKGDFLLREGGIVKTFYLMIDGAARLYEITNKGDEIIYRFVFENTFFTEYISFFKQLPTEANIVLLENSTLLAVSYKTFQNILCKLPGWQGFMLSLMVENTTLLHEKERMMMSDDPFLTYKVLLSNMPFLFRRVEQKYIASYMGITPETFSRVKRKILFS
jgi:CRP/FNR family transcriptional regulator, anaerobic regulatory protein